MSRATYPLCYHITFGTYGTRLHGDSRGTVDRAENAFGAPIVGRDGEWQQDELSLLKFPPRLLTVDQRLAVQEVVPQVCASAAGGNTSARLPRPSTSTTWSVPPRRGPTSASGSSGG